MNDCPRQNPAYRPALFFVELVYRTGFTYPACPDTTGLGLPLPHSAAMGFSPALRPDKPVLRQERANGTIWRLPAQFEIVRGHWLTNINSIHELVFLYWVSG